MDLPPHRYQTYLHERYRAILAYTGLVSTVIGLLILLPLISLFAHPDEIDLLWSFVWPGTITIAGGLLVWLGMRPRKRIGLTYQEGAVIVSLAWLLAITAGAIPLKLAIGADWLPVIFESTSGWTTTGLSIVNVETAPRMVLLFRSIMQLAGGAGFAIITLSALTGPTGVGLSSAEGRGDLLVPHVQRSAKLVLTIYSGYVLAGIVALRFAGMSWFDAVNHAFCTLSTGGFSTRSASIGHWDSPAIEGVTIVLMLLGTLNFVTAWLILRGKWRLALRSGELHLEAVLIPVGALILLVGVTSSLYPTLEKGLRVAIFETISALSTTGFATVSFARWNGLGLLLLITYMIIGGGAGSTAGALKQIRIYVLIRAVVWEIRRVFLPTRLVGEPLIWEGNTPLRLDNKRVVSVSLYVFLYLVTLLFGTLILTGHGYSLQDSLFEFASAIGTVGLSVGVTAIDAPAGVLLTEIVGMLLGRLEFFALIVGVAKLVGDSRSML
jgi:trk system potassium uptake protein TrkH